MDYLANSGRLLKEKRGLPAFLVCSEGIAEKDGDLASLYLNQGVAFMYMGKREQAIESFEKACELAPDDLDAKHNLELAKASDDCKEELIFRGA